MLISTKKPRGRRRGSIDEGQPAFRHRLRLGSGFRPGPGPRPARVLGAGGGGVPLRGGTVAAGHPIPAGERGPAALRPGARAGGRRPSAVRERCDRLAHRRGERHAAAGGRGGAGPLLQLVRRRAEHDRAAARRAGRSLVLRADAGGARRRGSRGAGPDPPRRPGRRRTAAQEPGGRAGRSPGAGRKALHGGRPHDHHRSADREKPGGAGRVSRRSRPMSTATPNARPSSGPLRAR